MNVEFMDSEAALAAMDLQERVDKAAREFLDEMGRLPMLIVCHPDEPHAGRIIGYTVKMDPKAVLGQITLS